MFITIKFKSRGTYVIQNPSQDAKNHHHCYSLLLLVYLALNITGDRV